MDSKVYLLEHLHTHANGEECLKRIGIFTTRERALAAVGQLVDKSGFRNHPEIIEIDSDEENGFYISEVELDELSWLDGFITVRDDGTEIEE